MPKKNRKVIGGRNYQRCDPTKVENALRDICNDQLHLPARNIQCRIHLFKTSSMVDIIK